MSIASELLSSVGFQVVRQAEKDARDMAKEHGAKIRRHPYSGIDVKFSDGSKKHYHGWLQLRHDLVKLFDLVGTLI